MAYYWSSWLATALQSDPFVAQRLVLTNGWETRGRPPSQFSYVPSGVLDHHTACMCKVGHKPDNCLGPIINGHSDVPGPISQLLGTFTPLGVAWNGSNPDPRIIVVAAGRSNHAGTGEWPWGAPNGNGSALGIEWCGPPATPWPDVVIELRARVTAAILRHNGWSVSQSTIHWEYARPQGRKIDPSGRWTEEPNLGQTAHWSPDRWRAEINKYIGKTPEPSPPKPPDPKPPTTSTYTVQAGDSWWSISQKFGVSMDALIAANPPATSATVIHPGQVLKVPGTVTPTPPPPTTNWAAEGAKMATPPATMKRYYVYTNTMWLQAVLSSMNKVAADGGGPIYNPAWVGADSKAGVPNGQGYYADQTYNAVAYWQSKNGLTADGIYGSATASKMAAVRGK